MTRLSRCALCRSRWSSRWATNTSGICVKILAVRQRQVPEVEVERPHAAFYGDLSRVDAAMYIAGNIADNEYSPVLKEISQVAFPRLVSLSLSNAVIKQSATISNRSRAWPLRTCPNCFTFISVAQVTAR